MSPGRGPDADGDLYGIPLGRFEFESSLSLLFLSWFGTGGSQGAEREIRDRSTPGDLIAKESSGIGKSYRHNRGKQASLEDRALAAKKAQIHLSLNMRGLEK